MDPHDTSRCTPLQLLQCFTLSRTSALRPKKSSQVLTPAARGDNMEDTDLDAEIRRDLEALVPARPVCLCGSVVWCGWTVRKPSSRVWRT